MKYIQILECATPALHSVTKTTDGDISGTERATGGDPLVEKRLKFTPQKNDPWIFGDILETKKATEDLQVAK